MAASRNPHSSTHPLVWVVTSRDPLWSEAADALGVAGYVTAAVHVEELARVSEPRPDAVLVELPEGEEPSKVLEELDATEALIGVPRLVLVPRVSQADGLPVEVDPPTDFVIGDPRSIPWDGVRARLRRLIEAQARQRALAHERELADCARELSGAASWSLDPAHGVYTCSWEIAAQLDDRPVWERRDWPELLGLLPIDARAELETAVERVVRHGGQATLEHRITSDPGETRVLLHRIRRLGGAGTPVVGALIDVTEERLSIHRLQQLAHFDSLTGLVTRHHFLTQLSDALEAAGQDGWVALLYVDLDGLKRVNDSLGHRGGDVLLRQTAERLRRAVRQAPEVPSVLGEDQRPILGRMGGDEFTVLLPGLAAEAAERVGDALVQAFRDPFDVSGKRVAATASVGVASLCGGSAQADELVRHADAAMYEAKRRGGDRTDVYRAELDRNHSRRREVREQLREALVEDRLELHYQPRIELRSGRLIGAEALMRWNCPSLGRVSPAEFIPIAEETGLIEQVGDFAVDQACRDLRVLDQAGLEDVRVSVNVSAAQLMQDGYGSKLFSAVQAASTEPSRIELEVTESVAIFGLDQVSALLREIRSTGMYVALDDFGTGYSSLGVLLDLPLDCMKLDQSLVRDMHMNPDAASVIRAMILMAHSLGLTVVAEGVTEEAQERLLVELDCDEVQGFRFAPALPLAELIAFAKQRNGL